MAVSPTVQLIQKYQKAFENKDLEFFEKCLHKDYRHLTYPKSINQQAQTKDEFIGRLRLVYPKCTDIVTTIHSITEAPGKVVIHLTNQLKTASGVDMPYESLIIATFAVNDEGNLKVKQVEFGDSQAYIERINAFALV